MVVHLRCEQLEDRDLLAISAPEQLFIWTLNRARHDPRAYQLEQHLSVSLARVAARPPLAVNPNLSDSADFHAVDLGARNYFSHNTPDNPSVWPNKMARDAGYALPALFVDNNNFIESLAAGTFYTNPTTVLNALIVDAGVSP